MNAETSSSDGFTSRRLIESIVELGVVILFVVWCFRIAQPFLVPVLWGLVIAVALYPLYRRLESALGDKSGLASTVFTLVILAAIIVPTSIVVESLVETSVEISRRLEGGDQLEIPPPPADVQEWPLIGVPLNEAWSLASRDMEGAVQKYEPQLRKIASAVLGLISGIGGTVAQSLVAIIIAGIMLGTARAGKKTAIAIGSRLGGLSGEKMVRDAAATIGSVAKGVVGVALIQGLMAGVALFLAGVPAAGLWTLGVMVLAVIQLPPILLLAPTCFWAFSNLDSTTLAVLYTIWCLVVSAADGFLKPLFLGRGVEIPMPVILIGAIGGMVSMGIIGLFLGAVVLSIGYSMFQGWIAGATPITDSGPVQKRAVGAGADAG